MVRFDVQENGDKKSLDTPGGDEMWKRLGAAGGLPFFVFLDSSGQVLVTSMEPARDGRKAGNIGHPDAPHEVDWFMEMLQKAAPRMTAEERGVIEKYLRSQKK
jgi:hypothetical protein